jgi:pyruvate dehydrogenase E1 component alpha subunit
MVIPEHRPEEEREAWKARDPIPRFENLLRQENLATQDELDRLFADVERDLEDAVRFAQDSPDPDPQTVTESLWAD